uniref:Uncharacterized protein n=1 Tax=Candidatus Methanophaga sp. ANME-1 ERB7 TaxID=2759913 RepID=A0A7G9Z1R2_9EURY|nr:hypothetical protein KIENGFOE_00002 [Methanosarcinales archaeon ANME-1 ERB7]
MPSRSHAITDVLYLVTDRALLVPDIGDHEVWLLPWRTYDYPLHAVVLFITLLHSTSVIGKYHHNVLWRAALPIILEASFHTSSGCQILLHAVLHLIDIINK